MNLSTLAFAVSAAAVLALSGCATTRAARDLSKVVTLGADAIVVGETINFESGKANLDPSSHELLDAVAEIIKANADITKVTIEGHTDNVGEAAANLELSKARAGAVFKYLTDKGIDAGRLVATGYGQDRPVTSNDTDQGRAQNRRVEFKVAR